MMNKNSIRKPGRRMTRSTELRLTCCALLLAIGSALSSYAAEEIDIQQEIIIDGWPKPVPVHISGFSGEVDRVLKQDLLFMGIAAVAPEQARFLVTGSNGGNVQGRLIEKVTKVELLAKAYTGSTLRAQTHAFADDIAKVLTKRPGIARTKIAFKVESGVQKSEVYIADYDGFNARPVTQDGATVAAPTWAGDSMLYYTSYKLGSPFIFRTSLGPARDTRWRVTQG